MKTYQICYLLWGVSLIVSIIFLGELKSIALWTLAVGFLLMSIVGEKKQNAKNRNRNK